MGYSHANFSILFAKYLQLGYYATIQFSPRVFYARTCSLMVMN